MTGRGPEGRVHVTALGGNVLLDGRAEGWRGDGLTRVRDSIGVELAGDEQTKCLHFASSLWVSRLIC